MIKEKGDDKLQVTRGYGLLEKFLAKKRTYMANRLIPPHLRGGRILDIGCGTFPYFLHNTVFAEKYGLDKTGQTVSYKQIQDGQSIQLIDFDIEKNAGFPFENHYFDVVSMLAVVEHVQPSWLSGLIAEIYRVLKPGGVCVITTPPPWTELILKVLAQTRFVSLEEINDHKRTYDRKTIVSMLSEGGFESRGIRSGYFEGYLNVWAVARKKQ